MWNWRKIPELLSSILSFVFYSPSYINLFLIYAFCRIDDLTWGTKNINSTVETETNIKETN